MALSGSDIQDQLGVIQSNRFDQLLHIPALIFNSWFSRAVLQRGWITIWLLSFIRRNERTRCPCGCLKSGGCTQRWARNFEKMKITGRFLQKGFAWFEPSSLYAYALLFSQDVGGICSPACRLHTTPPIRRQIIPH